MLVFLAVLIALIPLVAIVYPFLRGQSYLQVPDDSATKIDSIYSRWQVLTEGISILELDHDLSNLNDVDYIEARDQYLLEANTILDEMGLNGKDRESMFSQISVGTKDDSRNE